MHEQNCLSFWYDQHSKNNGWLHMLWTNWKMDILIPKNILTIGKLRRSTKSKQRTKIDFGREVEQRYKHRLFQGKHGWVFRWWLTFLGRRPLQVLGEFGKASSCLLSWCMTNTIWRWNLEGTTGFLHDRYCRRCLKELGQSIIDDEKHSLIDHLRTSGDGSWCDFCEHLWCLPP